MITLSVKTRLALYARQLGSVTDINILYPLAYEKDEHALRLGALPEKRLKVLWLIHGGTDNCEAWTAYTQLPLFAEAYPNLMIVMPTVYDFHSMLPAGEDYMAYVAQELPAFIQNTFPASARREDNFIAGLSMGGYFAWRVALTHPERYACAGAFSSPLDIEEDMAVRHAGATDYPAPREVRGNPRRDLFEMLRALRRAGACIPDLFQTCGIQDMTHSLNIRMRDMLDALQIPHTYMEWPGAHDWRFWNSSIEKFLRWLPLKEDDRYGTGSRGL